MIISRTVPIIHPVSYRLSIWRPSVKHPVFHQSSIQPTIVHPSDVDVMVMAYMMADMGL